MNEDWHHLFDPKKKNHVLYGNSIKSRVFVVSGNYKMDEEYVKALKLKTKIQWKVTNPLIPEYSGLPEYSIDKTAHAIINEIKNFCTTNVILSKVPYKQQKELIELLCFDNICKSINVEHDHFQIIELINIFLPYECTLMSNSDTETNDWKPKFLNMVKEGLVKNDKSTVVTIFSGPKSSFTNCLDLRGNIYLESYKEDEMHLRDLKKEIKEYEGSCNIKFNLENIKNYHVCATHLQPFWLLSVLMEIRKFLGDFRGIIR